MTLSSRLQNVLLSDPLLWVGGFCLLPLVVSLALAFPSAVFAQGYDDAGGEAAPETTGYPGLLNIRGVDLVALFYYTVYDPDRRITLDVVPGSVHSIDFISGNVGDEAADHPVVEKIYFSRDLIQGNADDILLTTTPPHLVGPHNSGTEKITTTIQIPHGLEQGSYYLLLVADADHAVTEADEDNNYNFVGLTVLGGNDGPDLRIRSVLDATPIPDTSQPCDLPNTPRCDRCGGVGELPCLYRNFNDLIQRCGDPARTVRVEFLNDGTMQATPGPFGVVGYLADHVLDSDGLVLASRPGPSSVDPQDPLHWRLDLVVPTDAPMGFYNLYFKVDSEDVLAEGNEINNYRPQPVVIRVNVDLEPENLIVHGDRPDGADTRPYLTVGQSADIEYRIRNLDVSAPGSTYREAVWLADHQGNLLRALVASPVHGEILCLEAGPGVNAIGSLDVALTVPLDAGLEPGDYRLVVRADGLNDLRETDETNNSISQPILLIPPTGDRDLALGDLGVPMPSGSTLDPGETFQIYYTLENYGVEPVTGPFRERFYLSRDQELDPAQDILVAASPPHNITIQAREGEAAGTYSTSVSAMTAAGTPPGDYYLLVQLDAEDEVPETREGNNVASHFALTLGTQGCNEGPNFSGPYEADFVSGGVELSWWSAWSTCSPSAFDYTVYRATSNSLPALLTHPLATHLSGLSYRDDDVAPGSTYWYLVRATDTVNGIGEENTSALSATIPPAPGMFFEVSPGGSAGAAVAPGTEVTVSWNIPGATDSVLVGIGGFSGPSGSASVEIEETTTFVLYATVDGLQGVHTATGYVTGSAPQAASHGPCAEPASTAIEIDGVLHYCRGVRNAQEPSLDKPAVWIPYTAADWELLVGPAAQPWSPYCFSAVGGDGQYAPFRYHIPGTAPNEWRSSGNVAGLPEIAGDGLDNNCNDSIDE